jgi:hypothetical protein
LVKTMAPGRPLPQVTGTRLSASPNSGAFLIIAGVAPFQTADDLKAQLLDATAEGGGGKPGVQQERAGEKPGARACLSIFRAKAGLPNCLAS